MTTQPGKSGRALGPARVRKTYRVLSMTMKHAVRTHRIALNPCHDHDLPRLAEDHEHVYLTHDQREDLADAAGPHRLLVLVLGYCGIRWAEVSALKAVRVNVGTRRLRIVQNYTDVRGMLALGPVKNHEKRSLPLPRSFSAELQPLLEGKARDDLLFTSPENKPLRYGNFRTRVFDPAVKAAGLWHLGVTPHKPRHTAPSLAIAAGADVKVVQTMLGHKDAARSDRSDVY